MALKPTIYKARISLAHIENNLYDNLDLTLALHPSETLERMMARVLAFSMNAGENLFFTRGLSSVDEPDIWARTLDDRVALWIEVGEPSSDRIKKAARISGAVKVYSFNLKSENWWAKEKEKFKDLKALVFQFQYKGVKEMAGLAGRTMDLSITISEGVVYVSSERGDCEIQWVQLQ